MTTTELLAIISEFAGKNKIYAHIRVSFFPPVRLVLTMLTASKRKMYSSEHCTSPYFQISQKLGL